MKSAMQDLREDLVFTIDSTKEALLEIENVAIRTACQEVVRLTLKNIIKRIDDELLEMEKQQIVEAFTDGTNYNKFRNIVITPDDEDYALGKQYYNETFNK